MCLGTNWNQISDLSIHSPPSQALQCLLVWLFFNCFSVSWKPRAPHPLLAMAQCNGEVKGWGWGLPVSPWYVCLQGIWRPIWGSFILLWPTVLFPRSHVYAQGHMLLQLPFKPYDSGRARGAVPRPHDRDAPSWSQRTSESSPRTQGHAFPSLQMPQQLMFDGQRKAELPLSGVLRLSLYFHKFPQEILRQGMVDRPILRVVVRHQTSSKQ